MPVIYHPPGTPISPDQPFANVCILFAPKYRPAIVSADQRNDVERREHDEEAFESFKRRLYDDVSTSNKYPLVPRRERDLEDIAFEVLRERYPGR
ncbi:hypothetical protein AYR66_02580 [Noviherbaspirillum denitrificans]|uniref:Uncharacterized protein n=1 Tax=Noviherbaspirillum denitrificans TaxID=1968433 RepID=A0A254T6T8_9BURK|nr:hypothetical protein AYR66_02580 [Noviherbaspirillum denitrificans]